MNIIGLFLKLPIIRKPWPRFVLHFTKLKLHGWSTRRIVLGPYSCNWFTMIMVSSTELHISAFYFRWKKIQTEEFLSDRQLRYGGKTPLCSPKLGFSIIVKVTSLVQCNQPFLQALKKQKNIQTTSIDIQSSHSGRTRPIHRNRLRRLSSWRIHHYLHCKSIIM